MTDRPRQISRASGAWALLAALLMLIASPAHASRIQANASEAIESIRAAVPNADLIVVLDNGSEQRRSDAGRAFTSILTDFGLGQISKDHTALLDPYDRLRFTSFAAPFDQRDTRLDPMLLSR